MPDEILVSNFEELDVFREFSTESYTDFFLQEKR